ncbi:hypothetical protein ES702_04669 [subsurface metagenome]
MATASPFKFTKSVMESINSRYKEFDDFELIEKMADLAQIPIPRGIKDIERKPLRHKMICGKEEMRTKLAEILNL